MGEPTRVRASHEQLRRTPHQTVGFCWHLEGFFHLLSHFNHCHLLSRSHRYHLHRPFHHYHLHPSFHHRIYVSSLTPCDDATTRYCDRATEEQASHTVTTSYMYPSTPSPQHHHGVRAATHSIYTSAKHNDQATRSSPGLCTSWCAEAKAHPPTTSVRKHSTAARRRSVMASTPNGCHPPCRPSLPDCIAVQANLLSPHCPSPLQRESDKAQTMSPSITHLRHSVNLLAGARDCGAASYAPCVQLSTRSPAMHINAYLVASFTYQSYLPHTHLTA